MQQRLIPLVAVLSICAALPAFAQTRPNFTGTWLEDMSQRQSPYAQSGSARGGARALSAKDVPVVISHTADTITIERNWIEHVRHVHHLDGREDRNRNGAQVHTTRTRWDGARLVTEGTTLQTTNQGETYWKLKEVRWMNPKGEMVLETTRVNEDGRSTTIVQVFKRRS